MAESIKTEQKLSNFPQVFATTANAHSIHSLDEAHLSTSAKPNCPDDDDYSLFFSMPVH